MRDIFQVDELDLAGRIGRIRTRHGEIQTPALLPVIHPYNQKLPVSEIKKLGFQAIMTNAYITMKKFGDGALKKGIHEIIGFDGPIMTDSGGYQVLKYGEVETNPLEMAKFEEGIGTDLAIILDTPTGRRDAYDDAEETVDLTLAACKETLAGLKERNSLWIGPVQGGKFLDLVNISAKSISKMDFDMFALGSPTVVMESYNFILLAKMVLAAKKVLPSGKPFHLFGLGHPLPLSLAVALGCDTFDSASYWLYAKDGRYITDLGTRHIEEITYLSCNCPVCYNYTAPEIQESEEKVILLARHNIHVLWREIQSTRQAIREGRLWEYVGSKARSHPNLWSAFNYIAKNWDYLEKFSPFTKERGIFISGSPDDLRPEIQRYNARFELIKPKKNVVVLPNNTEKPFLFSPLYLKIDAKADALFCTLKIPFGLIPAEISDIYPFSQAVVSEDIPEDVMLMKRVQERVKNQLKMLKPNRLLLIIDNRDSKVNRFLQRILKPSKTIKLLELKDNFLLETKKDIRKQ
ncbi:MAG: tRNA guanosine(15) transglycosylase TgtA [Thaumarchaeota archaeon]|nr:tRNA guanosine(15) transglycosylase TgtA [Nitrososphaerota archaeon]